ncbi:MAG: DUF4129 domain-containing protein, partial [Actinomycetota bacterium]|nr:DUF4129 domain-containing protein [Actinomycetota bacterium]
GSLVRGVASLDPVSIVVTGLLLSGAALLFVYGRRYVARKRRRSEPKHPVEVSDIQLYSRYKALTAAFEEAGITREEHETPEEYARGVAERLDEPGVARLGEIYLHARFRRAVPAEMAEEFDRLEPEALAAAERLKEASKAGQRERPRGHGSRFAGG